MKVLVVGAGVIGTIYGWAVSESGHEVTHVVRPGRSAGLANGVGIDMFDRRPGHKKRNVLRYDIKVTEDLGSSEHYDIVIVPVHHYELNEALAQFAPRLKDSDFVLLTQNWEGTAQVDSILPQARYVYGDAKAGGTFRDGVLVSTLYTIDIGQVGGRHDECLSKATTLFGSADLKPRLRDNILHYLWVQYAITGGLWPVLVRGGSFDAALRDSRSGDLAMAAARECLNVTVRRGVALGDYPETRIYYRDSLLFKRLAFFTMRWMLRRNEYNKRCSAHALSDPKEIQTFYYDLLKTGRELGVEMPVMASFEPDIEAFCRGAH